VKNKMSKMFKKSQAAMEFLMTYGWAILVVLVAIGALAYFGVLSPDKFLPAKCQLPAGIACMDFKINAGAAGVGNVNVVLKNALGSDLTGVTVAISDSSGVVLCAASGPAPLTNGAEATFTTAGCVAALTSGEKFAGDVDVSYSITGGLSHVVHGSITGRVD